MNLTPHQFNVGSLSDKKEAIGSVPDLALRLATLGNEKLRSIHQIILRALGEKPPKHDLNCVRLIHLHEGPFVKRGSSLPYILQTTPEDLAGLFPLGTDGNRVPSAPLCNGNQTVAFRSKSGCPAPVYFRSYPDLKDREISASEAAALLEKSDTDHEGYLLIESDFPKIGHEWTVVLRADELGGGDFQRGSILPFEQPALQIQYHPHSDFVPASDAGLFARKPLIITSEDLPSESQSGSIPESEVPSYLRNFFATVKSMIEPDRARIISTILLIYHAALKSGEMETANRVQKQDLEYFLQEAECDWNELFLKQKQAAATHLNTEVTAHTWLKTRMIFQGQRETQIASYFQNILIPLALNFAKKRAIQLKKISAAASSAPTLPERTGKGRSADLTTGLILAAPSLASLIPIGYGLDHAIADFLNQNADQGIEHLSNPLQTRDPFNLPRVPTWLPGIERIETAVETGVREIQTSLETGLHGLNETLFEGLHTLNDTLGKFVSLVVVAQFGAALAGILVVLVSIKGSLVLGQAQKLLFDRIDELQNHWPSVRSGLEAMLPELRQSTEPSERAALVVDSIYTHLLHA